MFFGFIEESALGGSAPLLHAVSNIYGCAIIGSIKRCLRRHQYVLYGVSSASDPPSAIRLPVVVVVVVVVVPRAVHDQGPYVTLYYSTLYKTSLPVWFLRLTNLTTQAKGSQSTPEQAVKSVRWYIYCSGGPCDGEEDNWTAELLAGEESSNSKRSVDRAYSSWISLCFLFGTRPRRESRLSRFDSTRNRQESGSGSEILWSWSDSRILGVEPQVPQTVQT
jgi:hypothetical protein